MCHEIPARANPRDCFIILLERSTWRRDPARLGICGEWNRRGKTHDFEKQLTFLAASTSFLHLNLKNRNKKKSGSELRPNNLCEICDNYDREAAAAYRKVRGELLKKRKYDGSQTRCCSSLECQWKRAASEQMKAKGSSGALKCFQNRYLFCWPVETVPAEQ